MGKGVYSWSEHLGNDYKESTVFPKIFSMKEQRRIRCKCGVFLKDQLLILSCYSSGCKSNGPSVTVVQNGENFQLIFFFLPSGSVGIIPQMKAGNLQVILCMFVLSN